MKKLSKPRPGEGPFDWDVDSPAKTAKLRMVELPTEDAIPLEKQFIFPREDLWVPVAVVNGNIHILPGVPRLCKSFPSYRTETTLFGWGAQYTAQLRASWTA